ncbi:uncharacterized protein si:dkey-32e6.3 isoform X2 [Corythoichthys intestinalis]|uniref:uncharacterized protein si:dkey-32e6.3 isoform X2 n=1 Tax=Corythoichthys intestinalis TaxID=161448 RepID=UPI0025A55E59|nr:uncharacterized protein si:dkey-32e6.3 isoform X2 [Corythoichthys intestinalis]
MADIIQNNSHQTEDTDEENYRDDSKPAHGPNDILPACPPQIKSSKKIVLHVDLNNTILVSDAVRCQGTVAALDYFLTTVTWGQMRKGKWEWLSDSPSLHPPCDNAISYYSQFGATPCFTSTAGRRFRGILEEHLQQLRWPEGVKLSVNNTPGKIRCNQKGVLLTRGAERLSTRDGERGLYQFFSSANGVGGFQDDYQWWMMKNFSIQGGKPLWVDPFDQHVHHIFIDDNIRQNDKDTVVHPKVFIDPEGSDTRTACISELYDIALIQTDLLKAISEPNYFTRCVSVCQKNYEKNIQHGSG